MNIQDVRSPRPKLSMPFGTLRTKPSETTSGLSGRELREIVAAMIG